METTFRPAITIPRYRWGGAAFMLGNLLFIWPEPVAGSASSAGIGWLE